VNHIGTVPLTKFLNPKWGEIITCNLTILILSLFPLFIWLVMLTILRLKRDVCEHFLAINRETGAGAGVLSELLPAIAE